jgi:putative glutamine amidotransferase
MRIALNTLSLSLVSAFICFTFLIMPGCKNKNAGNQITIAISKGGPEENYKTYGNWLQKYNPTVKWIDMSRLSINSALRKMNKCSGLLLSGGGDVNPAKYGKANAIDVCEGIDDNRDTLELALIRKALELHMPILAICRGHQILNVYMGGTLVPDISSFATIVKHRCEDINNCYHRINIKQGSLLNSVTGQLSANVNSSHHQAVAVLAAPFTVTALADDGMMEAYGWRDTLNKSPLLSVQWHPERLPDSLEIMSKPIAEYFISKAIRYSHNK